MKTYDPSRDHDPLFSVTCVGRSSRLAPARVELERESASVKWGACPDHAAAGKLTGLVVQGEHLAWRHHTKRTVSGAQFECSASGQRVCEVPASATAQQAGPFCTCHAAQAAASGDLEPSAGAGTPDATNGPQNGVQR